MRTSHFSIILVSAFLFGCASTTPKVSPTVKVDAWATFFPTEAPVRLDQFQLSYEVGLHSTPIVTPIVSDGSPPRPSRVKSSVDYSRRDMSLIDTTPLPPIDLK